MSYTLLLFVALLCLLFASSAFAADISGVVTLQYCAAPAQPVVFDLRPANGSASFSRSITLDNQGAYTLTNLPAGRFKIGVKGRKWLRVVWPNMVDTTNGSVLGLNTMLLAGDANDDNSVDFLDNNLLAAAFGSIPAR